MDRHGTVGLFASLAALWGFSFVATRATVRHVPPVLLAALRFDVAGLVVFGFAAVTADRWRPRTRADWMVVGLGAAFFVAAHHALLFAGQQYVSSAVAGVVISLDPILAAAFAAALLPDESVSFPDVVGFGFGVLGVGVIANPDPNRLLSADVRGVTLVFLSAAAFALGAVLTRRFRTEPPGRSTDLPVRSMQAWMMLLGAPLLHVLSFALPSESFAAAEWTPEAVLGLGYLALVAGGVGYLLYFALLDRLGPVEINLVGYVAPAFAAVGGWIVLGERLAPTTVVGFCSIVAGFALLERDALRTEVRQLREESASRRE